jgi:hypothetical protein
LTNGIGRRRHIVGLRSQTGETADRFRSHVLIGIGSRDLRQHCGVVEARDRRAPHARVSVLSRKRAQRVSFVRANVVDRRGTNGWIRVLPARGGTKLFKNAHALHTSKSGVEPNSDCLSRTRVTAVQSDS